jgi:hypothetical protein
LQEEYSRSHRTDPADQRRLFPGQVAKQAPEGARLVKAFKTTFAGTLVDGRVGASRSAVCRRRRR